MRNEATNKKSWVKPRVVERRSMSDAQIVKQNRTLEAVITVGGLQVVVGPAS